MKLVPVDTVPKRRSNYHDLQSLITEFMEGDAEIVRIDLAKDDYKSVGVARTCFWAAVKRSGYPIKVWLRDKKIFLSKK